MLKSNKEITNRLDIDTIITKSLVCRISFAVDNSPYMVPVSFGYDGKSIFVHTAEKGKKISFLKSNNNICFEFDTDVSIVKHDKIACKWTTAFKSVIGLGQMIEQIDLNDRIYAMNQIMLQYSGTTWAFDEKMLKHTKLWKIEISEISGKLSEGL